MARYDDWKNIAKYSVGSRNYQPTIDRFHGDPQLAATYIPISQALLGDLSQRLALGGIDQGLRQVQLPDGTIIRVGKCGYIQTIDIDVRPSAAGGLAEIPVYEFAATNPAIPVNLHRWFIVSLLPGGGWVCRSYPNHNKFFVQPSLADYPSLGYIILFGYLIMYAPNKVNSQISYTQKGAYGGAVNTKKPMLSQGAGDLLWPVEAVGLYGNYIWDSPIKGVPYWYGLVGRDGPLGLYGPVAEANIRGKYTVGISVRGTIIATRVSDGEVQTYDVELPDWVGASEYISGPWGAWKFDSTGLRAISVLHGNPFCFDAYSEGFDLTRILDPDDESLAVASAFKSGVFVIDITINEIGDNFSVFGVASELAGTEAQGVLTCGLGYTLPERNSNGIYYIAADFVDGDTPCYAYVEWEMRRIRKWEFEEQSAWPYGDAELYAAPGYPNGPEFTGPYTTVCGTGNIWYGFCGFLAFESKGADRHGVFTDTCNIHAELKFSESLDMAPVVLRHEGIVKTVNFYMGLLGSVSVWYYGSMNNGTVYWDSDTLSYKWNSSLVMLDEAIETTLNGIRTNYFPDEPDHVCLSSGEAVRYGSSITPLGNITTWDEVTSFENQIYSKLRNIDLRGRTVAYTQKITTRAPEHGIWTDYPGYSEGTLYLTGSDSVTTIHFKSPVINGSQVIATEHIPDPPPQTTRWSQENPPAGYVNWTDENDYPLITRLWHHQVLGTENPAKLDDFGAPIGPFADLPNYFPRQTFHDIADTIASHPKGYLAGRCAEALVDFIHCRLTSKIDYIKNGKRYYAKAGTLLDISHREAIMSTIPMAEDMIARYVEIHPEVTREQAIEATGAVTEEVFNNLVSYVHRGEWVI